MIDNIFTFLKDDDGESNAVNIDDYYFIADRRCKITRIIVNIVDNGPPSPSVYGNSVVMENGLNLLFIDRNNNQQSLIEQPVKKNSDWRKYCHDVESDEAGGGEGRVSVRWTFDKSGLPIKMRRNERLIMRVADDLTDLVGHYFHIQGHYY